MSYNYLKGVKMSKLLINKLVLPVVLLVLSIGTASAALQCGAQPSCADLGYSKTHISGCTDYIYCPFDTSYKNLRLRFLFMIAYKLYISKQIFLYFCDLLTLLIT